VGLGMRVRMGCLSQSLLAEQRWAAERRRMPVAAVAVAAAVGIAKLLEQLVAAVAAALVPRPAEPVAAGGSILAVVSDTRPAWPPVGPAADMG